MPGKYTLFVSKDLGCSYQELYFEEIPEILEYLAKHKSIHKGRWCVEDEGGKFLMVCSLFRDMLISTKAAGCGFLSFDEKLLKFLNMDEAQLEKMIVYKKTSK